MASKTKSKKSRSQQSPSKKGRKLSREQREKAREQRNQRIMSLVLVFLMIGSIAGIAAYNMGGSSGGQQQTIGEYDVVIRQRPSFFQPDTSIDAIVMTTDDKDVVFYSFPDMNSNIQKEGNLTDVLYNKSMVVLSGFETDELNKQLIDLLRYHVYMNAPESTQIGSALSTPDNSSQIPVITCENATVSQPVVMLSIGNKTQITSTDSCVDIVFTQQQTRLIRDKLLYSLYGVSA